MIDVKAWCSVIALSCGCGGSAAGTRSSGSVLSEFSGNVEVSAVDGDEVTGARITKPTRIKSGSSVIVQTERVRKTTGLHIGGKDDD